MYPACFVWNIEKYWEKVMLPFSRQLSFSRFLESLKSERIFRIQLRSDVNCHPSLPSKVKSKFNSVDRTPINPKKRSVSFSDWYWLNIWVNIEQRTALNNDTIFIEPELSIRICILWKNVYLPFDISSNLCTLY